MSTSINKPLLRPKHNPMNWEALMGTAEALMGKQQAVEDPTLKHANHPKRT
jgi:hypothetical protein